MHKSSMRLMSLFKEKYLSDMEGATILDIGSQNVGRHRRSYRQIFEDKYKYTGMDIVAGINVDIVGYENITSVYDVVISGQAMEHIARPWEWMKSITPYFTKYICVIAPHTWPEHRNAQINDYYRYMPDGMRELFNYAGIAEIEIIMDKTDTVGIGTKHAD